MSDETISTGRRGVLAFAIAAMSTAPTAWLPVTAWAASPAGPAQPIGQLDDALLAAMKAGERTNFATRYAALAPVVEQVFDLDAVLAASVGLSWPALPDAEKARLAAAFRRYTVSSYVANFNSYNGQKFEISPQQRAVGNGEVVVRTRIIRADGSPTELDYVMRRGPNGWKAVDVLTDGAISRVAVQRSDFRQLLAMGGVPALAAGLQRKVASLSGAMEG